MPNPPAPPERLVGRWRSLPALILAWSPALLVLAPALMVLARLAEPAGDAWHHVVSTLLEDYIWHTILLVGFVVLMALILGVPTAWWIASRSFPGRNVLRWALLLPLAMPGYVAAVGYVDAMEGLIPAFVWVRENYGVEAFLRVQDWTRWVLAITVMSATLYPYVFLTSLASFSRQGAATLEAGRLVGAGSTRLFWGVALPMARPAIVGGASLVAFETMNDYGVVSYFGLTPLTVGVFRLWLSDGELNAAVRLSLLLLVFAMSGLGIERLQRARRRFAGEGHEGLLTPRPTNRIQGIFFLVLCLIPLALGFLIPGSRLARWAWQSASDLAWKETLQAAQHSVILAIGTAVLVLAGAVLLLATQRAMKSHSLNWAAHIGLLGYAFPSALIAVGVGVIVASIAQLPLGGHLALSSSVFGLFLAYFVRFFAVGIQPIDSGLRRVPDPLHEAARCLGSRPWNALFRVDLRLAWPSLLAAATLVFLDVYKELTLTLVLRPFNFETLATRIFRLTDEGRIPEAALPSLLLVVSTLLILAPLFHFTRRHSP